MEFDAYPHSEHRFFAVFRRYSNSSKFVANSNKTGRVIASAGWNDAPLAAGYACYWQSCSGGPKPQALVYDILPASTTAVFSYAIDGSRKMLANEQFFVVAQTLSSKFVTNDSNKTRRVIYSCQQS